LQYNFDLYTVLLKHKIQTADKTGKLAVFVLLNVVYMHPVKWIKVYDVGSLTSEWSHSTDCI